MPISQAIIQVPGNIVTANQLSIKKDFILTLLLNMKYNYTNESTDLTSNGSSYCRFSRHTMAQHGFLQSDGDF